jgi:hypothetical protein
LRHFPSQHPANAFPKRETPKNKFLKSGLLLEPENVPSPYQLSPAIHHKFTIKKPRSATRFCQNPQQKQGLTNSKKLPQKRPSPDGNQPTGNQ